MALAFIEFEDGDESNATFRIDAGTNRYYAYGIGGGEASETSGVRLLRDRSFTSPLFGPVDEALHGRAVLTVPRGHFDREHHHIQLLTFRNRDGSGPAASEILDVPLRGAPAGDEDLPPLSFSRSAFMKTTNRNRPAQSVAFNVGEQRPASRAFFLQALLPLLPQVLPAVMPLISNLFGGGNGAAAATGPLQQLGSPRTIELITQLIQQLTGAAGASRTAAAPPATPAPAANTSTQASVYSSQMMFPIAALAGMLPSLMPLLQNVLTPQTIQSLAGIADPTRVIGVVTQGLQQLGQLALQGQQQQLDHLRALNPGVADPALDALLQSLSLGAASTAAKQIRYRRTDAVRLSFADTATAIVGGRPRVAYRRDRDITFPLAVETPKPIRDAELQILLKKRTGDVLYSRSQIVPRAESGRLEAVPSIPAPELRRLAAGEDFLVCAALAWKTKKGGRIGTSITQMITLVDELTLDRAEGEGEVIPLNDVQRYRDFWHKAWQGSFSKDRRRLTFDCRYYYAFDPKRETNGRMETVTRLEESGLHKESARLKSGMLVSAFALNQLIPQISSYPLLGDAELAALRTNDAASHFHQAARLHAKMSGRPGTDAAMWVYPEVRMHKLTLKRAENVSESGHVVEFSDRAVYFPVPVMAHFIGAGTES